LIFGIFKPDSGAQNIIAPFCVARNCEIAPRKIVYLSRLRFSCPDLTKKNFTLSSISNPSLTDSAIVPLILNL
jgi:hypothetical protein